MTRDKHGSEKIKLPSPGDWRTTDADEINRRRLRAQEESFQIANLDSRFPIFSNFRVQSGSGMRYTVEIRDARNRQFACDCVDFRINGLGTCKHVEAVLLLLQKRFRRLFEAALKQDSNRIDLVPDRGADTVRACGNLKRLPKAVRQWFDPQGLLMDAPPETALETLAKLAGDGLPELRVSLEVEPWMAMRRHAEERKALRHEYELKVQSGEWPAHETLVPLFPYQREGMLHLAFTERGLLADEMGLGKTIQAIAACALLHRLGQAARVLVVTPASLKTEWEEQILRFTALPFQLVYGARPKRLLAYAAAPFFTIVNYEQMLADALEVNARLKPDVVVLDEAQRIKNWNTKTTQAIKRLRSRYAFVLTGTPIENRIDELHSLMDFLNPTVLGPLFRFNREYYEFDERGRPSGYRNLQKLHTQIAPYMLRRRKTDVETELPERTDQNHFVTMTELQKQEHQAHAQIVLRLVNLAKRRPLTQQEQDKLMREMAMMRMVCDTLHILDQDIRDCPKVDELEKILEECRENDAKVIIFSEWERMLELVRELCEKLDLGYAWHTGSVPQKRRRAEINSFKSDPQCRVFLSTDSGSTGLNLQTASVVINCDLPWNPAKLEQRIARAWRKHQTKPVMVINLVSENTIEHRMLDTLANKQALADGVLDLRGDLSQIKMRSGRQAFLARLQQLVSLETISAKPEPPKAKVLPADRPMGFAQAAFEQLGASLVRCEEKYPKQGPHSVIMVVVERDAGACAQKLLPLHQEYFGQGDPLAPTQLEVIDRATYDALERLAAAGLITLAARVSRPLHPTDPAQAAPAPLSDAERQKAAEYRQQAARKLKMARLLAEGEFFAEALPPMLEALLQTARALALENRLPEPAEIQDAVLPPLSAHFGAHLPAVRSFVGGANDSWPAILPAMSKLTSIPAAVAPAQPVLANQAV